MEIFRVSQFYRNFFFWFFEIYDIGFYFSVGYIFVLLYRYFVDIKFFEIFIYIYYIWKFFNCWNGFIGIEGGQGVGFVRL